MTKPMRFGSTKSSTSLTSCRCISFDCSQRQPSSVRTQRGKLVATPLGKTMVGDARQGSLPAILFHLALWHMDLGFFGRGLLGSWPQADIGIVLWSLSVSAGDWQPSEKLTRLCTIPKPEMFSGTWDRTSYAMEARILRPLLWFGLLEHRSERTTESRFDDRHFYRKAALFDRMLTFDVAVDSIGSADIESCPACFRSRFLCRNDHRDLLGKFQRSAATKRV